RGARITSDSFGSGKGGEIQINAGNVLLEQQAIISAKSSAGGNAGSVTLNVGNLQSDHSTVTTEAALTDGGNITVNASNLINLIDSQMTASVGGGPSTVGGNVTIDPRYVVLNDSSIIANAYEGTGGNIRIVAAMFLSSPESLVSASSRLGIDGTVDIKAPITSISGTLVPVSGTYLQTGEMLRDRCMARLQGSSQSSLTVSGRQGLPPRPGIVLPAPAF
ncbi:MAG: S-layer family protein, partial [Syntrophales bacterium LBB04]|nr:S-layer family protein [Syntrophales bacterium LBB04]